MIIGDLLIRKEKIYASSWKRVLSLYIDIGIVFLPIVVILKLFRVLGGLMVTEELEFLIAVLVLIYFTIFESSSKQATPGKLLLGIVVSDFKGNRISLLRAVLRNLCKVLTFLTFLIGYTMAGFTKKRQALHDIITGCQVMNKPQKITNP